MNTEEAKFEEIPVGGKEDLLDGSRARGKMGPKQVTTLPGMSPHINAASLHSGRRGSPPVESQQDVTRGREHQGPGGCPSVLLGSEPPEPSGPSLEMSIHVNLMRCRGWAGPSPASWSRGQMSADSGRRSWSHAFWPEGSDVDSRAATYRLCGLGQASSRSQTSVSTSVNRA